MVAVAVLVWCLRVPPVAVVGEVGALAVHPYLEGLVGLAMLVMGLPGVQVPLMQRVQVGRVPLLVQGVLVVVGVRLVAQVRVTMVPVAQVAQVVPPS